MLNMYCYCCSVTFDAHRPQAVRDEANHQRQMAINRKKRRNRIEQQKRELEMLKAMKGRSMHVRFPPIQNSEWLL